MPRQDTEVQDIEAARRSCTYCGLRSLCLPFGLDARQVESLDRQLGASRPLTAGQMLVRAGDPFRCLYIVRAGALKSTVLLEGGDRQVIGFHLPGELVGLDALYDHVHRCEVEALQRSRVCPLPFEPGTGLSLDPPELQAGLMRLVGRETVIDHDHLTAMGRREARARVALVLRSLVERRLRLQLGADEIRLPMSREDLGNYLGLAEETVSRSLTRMQREGVIRVSRKLVHILDHVALAQMCGDAEAAVANPPEPLRLDGVSCALRQAMALESAA